MVVRQVEPEIVFDVNGDLDPSSEDNELFVVNLNSTIVSSVKKVVYMVVVLIAV